MFRQVRTLLQTENALPLGYLELSGRKSRQLSQNTRAQMFFFFFF